MPETASLNEIKVHGVEPQSEGGESFGRVPESPGDLEGAALVAKTSKAPSINAIKTSLNEESEQSAAVKGKQSDETIENLVALFRDFLEAAPNPAAPNPTHNVRRNTVTGPARKRFFGLTKSLSPETGSNDRFDYEQKYPRDRFGEEAADNARVWLTYLDEAESFDRERVEGWKETADVLLVFAGLFSGVITTFVSQASQSLQQDNTQVSASLLFETVQILRTQFSGIPISHVPNSTLTPTSPFTPSTNAFLVNGLWFTSLAITLSTALFAVLAKQWLYYYLTSITGTAREKARARQLRFRGFELWKVGAIVDLLPILLHLAVGIFLTGIIILLFPLDFRVAWTIVVITGITYTLYFISVILPIRYPECPYTTSLTIYVGILFFFLRESLRWISAIKKGFQAVWRRISFQAVWSRIDFQALDSIQRLLRYIHGLFRQGFFLTLKLVRLISCGFRTLRPTIFTEDFPKFTRWREENIKKAVKNAAFLDSEALDWLYATSPNRSVHRIIARCVAVHPHLNQKLEFDICENLWQTLEVSEANTMDLHYGLYLDLLTGNHKHWHLLWSIPGSEESQLEDAEYRNYSRIIRNVIFRDYNSIMKDAINDDLELPPAMWYYLLRMSSHDEGAMTLHILTYGYSDLFEWEYDSTREPIRNAGVVSFRAFNKERGWWKFGYLYGWFIIFTQPDYSPDKIFETRYLLLIAIYRHLTSDRSFIIDKEQMQKSLQQLFDNFFNWLPSPNRHISSKQYLTFFKDIFCVDAFWSESMTSEVRRMAALCLDKISWGSMNSDTANHFALTECHDLSLTYQWYLRIDLNSDISFFTTPMIILLLNPQNRRHLSTILLNDPNAVSHFSKCLQNSWNFHDIYSGKKYIYPNLMDLLKSISPKMPLFTILYNKSVLGQIWKLIVFSQLDAKKFFLVVKSKLDQDKLDELYAAVIEQAQPDDSEVFDLRARQLGFYKVTDVLDALERSARGFGQIIGVPHVRLEIATEQSALQAEGAASRDHDIDLEERVQVPGPSERESSHASS